jgi:hypothetical protein
MKHSIKAKQWKLPDNHPFASKKVPPIISLSERGYPLQNYKKLLEIVEEMTIINMTLLKENACL